MRARMAQASTLSSTPGIAMRTPPSGCVTRWISSSTSTAHHRRAARTSWRTVRPVQANILAIPAPWARLHGLRHRRPVVAPLTTALFRREDRPSAPLLSGQRRHRLVAAPPPRGPGAAAGWFVFCCFNNPYKIAPALRRLDAAAGGGARQRAVAARRQADADAQSAARGGARGIDAARLVFAPSVPPARASGAPPLADLFLDTLPTTPIPPPAMRCGPVAGDHLPGTSFPGRVGRACWAPPACPNW